eukprot:jgi/Ulvmu1/1518/UM011_0248.1
MAFLKALLPLLLACIGDLRCEAQNGNQNGGAASQSFDLLPLEVVAAIPSTLLASGDTAIQIRGAAALQVVFSQPIIRLGADFGSESINAPFTVEFVDGSPLLGEGLLQRWVTTYIWRIDPPDLGWPTDADLTLKWNQMLTSWTGAELVTDVQDRTLQTPNLSLRFSSVQSEGAANATNGRWRADWRGNPLEIPTDGIARLRFTGSLVTPSVLANARVSTGGSGSQVRVFPVRCPLAATFFGAPIENEVCVEFEGLAPNTQYTVTLPSGTRYNDLAGPLREGISFTFRSRLPFTIPLRESNSITAANFNQAFRGVDSTTLRLLLIHGIAAEPANRDIASRVSLVSMGPAFASGGNNMSTPVAYNFTIPSRAYANIMAPLLPTHKYQLSISPGNTANPGVRSDPFFGSQPLETLAEGPDTVSFTTQRLTDRIEFPQSFLGLRFQSVPTGFEYPVILQKDPSDTERKSDTVVAVPILAVRGGPADFAVAELVLRMADSRTGGSLIGRTGAQTIALQQQAINLNNLFSVQGLAADTLLAPTGLAYIQTESRSSNGRVFFPDSTLISTGDVALGVISGSGSLTAWAVSAADGSPVAGVEITVYVYNFQSRTPVPQPAVTTDTQGVARVEFDFIGNNNFVSLFISGVTPSGQLVAVESSASRNTDLSANTLTELLVDRTVVAPGHLLHAWGYIRTETGGQVTIPASPPRARLRLCALGECTAANANVLTVDTEFGSFDGTILLTDAVIAQLGFNAGFLSLEICAGACPDGDWQAVSSVSITISDPRPPTAELLFTVPAFAPPNSTITLTGSTVSLLGSNVVGAEVDIQWRAGEAQGSLVGTAGANGNFTVELDLNEVAPLLDVGGSISFDAVWIGPTRERLTASGSVAIQFTPFTVELTTGVDLEALVPGRTFGIVAAVDSPNGPPSQDVVVTAVPITQALCEAVAGCPDSRFGGDGDDDYNDYLPSFGGGRFISPTPSAPLKPTEQDALLAAGEAVCTGLPAAGGSWSDCSWALPGFGIFAIVACVPAGQGSQRACAASYAGRLLQEWEDRPFRGPQQAAWRWAVPSGADGFEVGSEATLEIDSPVAGARALLVWASTSEDGLLAVTSLTAGINTASLPVPASCTLGCTADLLISWPSTTLPPTLPVAALFDSGAPVVLAARNSDNRWPIDVQQPILQPEVSIGAAAAATPVVEPLTNFTLSLSISQCASAAAASCGNPLAEAAEVVVLAVDKAWLLLQPYELPDPAALFDVNLSPFQEAVASTEGNVNPAAINIWRQANSEVLDMDPWARLLSLSNLDTPPEEWLENQFFDLSDDYSGYGGGYYFYDGYGDGIALGSGSLATAAAPASAPAGAQLRAASFAAEGDDSGGGAAEGGGSATQAPRLISPLDTTPFFRVARLAPGTPTQQLQLTAPAALTTYVVRAFAASATGDIFGSEETELIVRRVVSLTPSAPRLLRTGDNGTAGVVVTFSGTATPAAPVTVTVSVTATGPVQLTGPTEASLVFDGSVTQQETRFDLTAVTTGDVQLTFSAEAAAGSDALQVELPSLLTQAPVVVATSFAVTPGPRGFQEGLAIPAAVPGTGSLSVVAGVGNLPAQLAMTKRLFDATPRFPVTAPWPVSIMALYAVLNQYGDAALDAPITLQERAAEILAVAENTTVCVALTAAVDYAIEAFVGLTALTDLGLMYYPERAFPGWQPPEEPNVSLILASRLAFVWAGMFGAQPAQGRCGPGAGVATIFADSVTWLERGQEQLFIDAAESRTDTLSRAYQPLSLLATLWAVQGPTFDIQAAVNAAGLRQSVPAATPAIVTQVVEDLSLDRLISEIPNLSSFSTGLISLVLSDPASAGAAAVPANATAVVDAIQTRHTDRFRITARNAYIAISPESPSPASTASQAAVLLSALAAGNRTSVEEKHSNFIASRQGGTSPYFVSTRSVIQSMFALLEYDNVSGSTQPNLGLVVQSAPAQVLQASFTPQSNAIVEASISFDDLATPPAPLTFVANGTGEASVAALLNFVPAELPTTPQFRGLQVDLAIRALNASSGLPTGPLLSFAPLGATLHILAQVATPDDLQEATVQILLPGGLEPIDRNLDADGNTDVCLLPFFLRSFSGGNPFRRASIFWFPSCPRVETSPRNVTFFVDRLSPGTHEYSFLAIAASPGQYTVPPAIAFDDNQPEVTGLSAGQTFTVCRAQTCTPAESAAGQSQQRLPLDCPNDCSGAGLCDTGTGECVCDIGFAGIDCAMLTS